MDTGIVIEALDDVLRTRSADVLALPPTVFLAEGMPMIREPRDAFDVAAARFAARLVSGTPGGDRMAAVGGLVKVPGGWRKIGDALLAELAERGVLCLRMCRRRGRLDICLPRDAGLDALAAKAVAISVADRLDGVTGVLRRSELWG